MKQIQAFHKNEIRFQKRPFLNWSLVLIIILASFGTCIADVDRIVGQWKWSNSSTPMLLKADGTASHGRRTGEWILLKGGILPEYQITWKNETLIDTLKLGEDKNELVGQNQTGYKLRAARQSDSTPALATYSDQNQREGIPAAKQTDELKLAAIPKPQWELEGDWKFSNGHVYTFISEMATPNALPLFGVLKDSDGRFVAKWAGTWTRPGHEKASYELTFTDGVSIVGFQDQTLLVGEGGDSGFSARRVGYAPFEYAKGKEPITRSAGGDVAANELGKVDLNFLRVIRAVCDPWTNDPDQADDCRIRPWAHTELILGTFDDCDNDVVQQQMARILGKRNEITMAYKDQEREIALENKILDKGYEVETYEADAFGANKRVLRTDFGHYSKLDREFRINNIKRKWEGKIKPMRVEQVVLHRSVALELGRNAAQFYEGTAAKSNLVSVKKLKEGFEIENISGHDLTHLVLKIDMRHFLNFPTAFDFKVFYSPKLVAGGKRFCSASVRGFDPSFTPRNTGWSERELRPEFFRPDCQDLPENSLWLINLGGVVEAKVTAWALEGNQPENVMTFPDAAENGLTYEEELIRLIKKSPSKDESMAHREKLFLQKAPARLQLLATFAPKDSLAGKDLMAGTTAKSTLRGTSAPSPIQTWTNVQGKTVRAVFIRMEGENVIIRNTVGEQFNMPIKVLDEASQKQAREAAAQ